MSFKIYSHIQLYRDCDTCKSDLKIISELMRMEATIQVVIEGLSGKNSKILKSITV